MLNENMKVNLAEKFALINEYWRTKVELIRTNGRLKKHLPSAKQLKILSV
jgi:hypothetical protein